VLATQRYAYIRSETRKDFPILWADHQKKKKKKKHTLIEPYLSKVGREYYSFINCSVKQKIIKEGINSLYSQNINKRPATLFMHCNKYNFALISYMS